MTTLPQTVGPATHRGEPRKRAAATLALLGWAANLVLAVSAIVFYGLSASVEPSKNWGVREVAVGLALAFLAYAAVGALILLRRPENRVGWLLLAAALGFQLQGAAMEYSAYALVARPGALSGGETAAWLAYWIWVPPLTLTTTLLVLLFPNGRLLSRRWRPVVALAAVVGTLLTLSTALEPAQVDFLKDVRVENPYGVGGADTVIVAATLMLLTLAVSSAISLVLRYRRSRREERLQHKWFAAAGALLAATYAAAELTSEASTAVVSVVTWAFVVALAAIPVAIGIAVFKHRLHEIDVIIRRTLVYGAATGGLAGLYFALVLALQAVFSGFAGGSDLAIAVSTLAAFALFRPVRARVQRLVDRRFYRSRYDAAATVESFGQRLRQQVDLDAIESELEGVVTQTMQPSQVSVWIRERP